ncbi:hypothetical protein FORC065_0593 [Yersinia enterocolitica]|nr:hypothetical protein FORC065_0593 [Yersinia enterocolitica]
MMFLFLPVQMTQVLRSGLLLMRNIILQVMQKLTGVFTVAKISMMT